MNTTKDYVSQVNLQLWDYAARTFGNDSDLFDQTGPNANRPPVFVKSAIENNVLFPPGSSSEVKESILNTLPVKERHQFFGSMRSSQALAQSVFGCLKALGKAEVLQGLQSDQGLPALFGNDGSTDLQLESAVTYLGEPRQTSVDVFASGGGRVAVECKFTEPEFGTCSRPRLRKDRDPNYERDFCNGSYTRQRGRSTRCSLTEIGVRYWDFVPDLFDWDSGIDLPSCPLRHSYQLVRNVLAACTVGGEVNTDGAHALVIYDARNPAFQEGGVAWSQFSDTRAALRNPDVLRSCSWQRLAAQLEQAPDLGWLVQGLAQKYGINSAHRGSMHN